MKKKIKSKHAKKESNDSSAVGYEEIEFICPSCGKKVKTLIVKGVSLEGMLCQRCSQGEIQQSDFG